MARSRYCRVFLALFACVPAIVFASVSLTGTVRDALGASIAEAEVLLLTPELTVIATTKSNAEGRFTIAAPTPGRYVLIVRARAFGEVRQALAVGPAPGDPIDVVLQVGGLQENVTVAASRNSVETLRDSAQPVNIISAEDIADRVKTVVAQAVEAEPGVNLQRTSPTMAGIFVRGLTGNKVNIFVDGVRYSNGAQRGGVNTFLDLVEPDTLETIEVVRGPSSAQ
jgi:hemoglobin/transferrin/lactoferrin receptor protein